MEPAAADAVNLDFARNVVGKSRIAGGANPKQLSAP